MSPPSLRPWAALFVDAGPLLCAHAAVVLAGSRSPRAGGRLHTRLARGLAALCGDKRPGPSSSLQSKRRECGTGKRNIIMVN